MPIDICGVFSIIKKDSKNKQLPAYPISALRFSMNTDPKCSPRIKATFVSFKVPQLARGGAEPGGPAHHQRSRPLQAWVLGLPALSVSCKATTTQLERPERLGLAWVYVLETLTSL